MNPYEVLGVSPESTEAQIKAAYRQKAKTLHPDMPDGDREAFDELQMAYDVLMDPKRRDHYDKTGETKERQADNRRAVVITTINQAFEAAVQHASKSGKELHEVDMLALMRRDLEAGIQARARANADAKAALAKWTDLRKRFRATNKKKNIMGAIIDGRISGVESLIKQHDDMDKLAREALKALDGLVFDFEEQAAVAQLRFNQGTATGFGGFFSTG